MPIRKRRWAKSGRASKASLHIWAASSPTHSETPRRGGTLVTVHVPESRVEQITQIFKTHGAVDIEKRGAAWRAEGWDVNISVNLSGRQINSPRFPESVAAALAERCAGRIDGVAEHVPARIADGAVGSDRPGPTRW